MSGTTYIPLYVWRARRIHSSDIHRIFSLAQHYKQSALISLCSSNLFHRNLLYPFQTRHLMRICLTQRKNSVTTKHLYAKHTTTPRPQTPARHPKPHNRFQKENQIQTPSQTPFTTAPYPKVAYLPSPLLLAPPLPREIAAGPPPVPLIPSICVRFIFTILIIRRQKKKQKKNNLTSNIKVPFWCFSPNKDPTE